MTTLPVYVEGSDDVRSFCVEGSSFYVSRTPSRRTFGFHAGGRDGDVVADGAPEPGILDALLAGIEGLRWVYGGESEASTDAAIDEVERRLASASTPPYLSIARVGRGDETLARALFTTPPCTGARRSVYVAGGSALTVWLEPGGAARAELGAWGRPPDALFTRLEARTGASLEVVGVDGGHLVRRIPGPLVDALLDEALQSIGTRDIRVVDTFARTPG